MSTYQRTQPLRENPNCKEAYASFILYGDELDPDKLTRQLDQAPELARRREDLIEGPKHSIRQRTGVWSISSRGKLTTTSLERHIAYLLERLEPVASELRQAIDEIDLDAVFSCYWVSASGHGGASLSPSLLERVAKLRAFISLDPYFDTD